MKTNHNINLMYAIALLQGMVFYGPIATLYRQNRGVGLFQIALIESISLIVMILLEIPWGVVADRIGYKKTMLFCNALYFVSKIVFWKANGFGMFLTERLMLSVVLSGLSGCDTAFLYYNADRADVRRVYSIYGGCNTAGYVFAALTFSVLMGSDDAIAGAATTFTYAIAFILTVFLKETAYAAAVKESITAQCRSVMRALRQNRAVIPFLLALALLSETNLMVSVFLSQAQYLRGGVTIATIAVFAVFPAVSGLLGGFSDRFARKVGQNKLIIILFASGAASCLAMGLTAIPFVTVVCMVILRASASIMMPIGNHIQNQSIDIGSRAAVLSVYSVVMNLSAAGMDVAYGSIAQISTSGGMFLGFGFVAVGMILYLRWAKKQRIS